MPMYKMISKIILLMLLLTTVLAAPLQMQKQLQEIIQQQIPLLQSQEMNHQWILHQLDMLTQQQMQQQLTGIIQQPTPLLQPLQGTIQQQRLALEEQMYALQRFQMLQRMNLIPSSSSMNTRPILVIFPNNEPDMKRNGFNSLKFQNPQQIDDDTEVIDAEPTGELDTKIHPFRAFLLMPNSRSIIGDFISSIPFLPIEINVPDTISWIYNGIAGIISGIGQSLPFRPQTQPPSGETQVEENNNIKFIWNKLKRNQQMPIVMIPLPLGHSL